MADNTSEVEVTTTPPITVTSDPAGNPPPSNIDDILDKVRRQEGEKYSRKLKLLESKNKELEDKLSEASLRLEKFKSIEDGDVSLITKSDSRLKPMDNSDSVFAQELEKIKSKLSTYERENNELRRTIMVDALVKQFGGEIIPDMIVGNTQEELIASAEIAAAKYQEIKNSILKSIAINPTAPTAAVPSGVTPDQAAEVAGQVINQETRPKPTGTVPSPVQPNTGRSNESPVLNNMQSLAGMSPSERIKYLSQQTPEMREAIKKAAIEEQVRAFQN